MPRRAVRLLLDVRGRGAAVDLACHKGKDGQWWCCHISHEIRGGAVSPRSLEQRTTGSKASGKQHWRCIAAIGGYRYSYAHGQANCPLNERRQIQANSIGDRDGTATSSARRTSVAFAAEWKQNASQRSDRLTFICKHLGIADDGAAVDPGPHRE